MTRRKFQLYLSDCDVVAQSLTDKQLGRLFRAIVAYVKGQPSEGLLDTPQLVVAFGMMRGRLDEDTERRQAAAKRNRENGAKGGRPRKNGTAHAETHPIEKATADDEEPGEKTHSVLKKPTGLLKNPLGFYPLQEAENQDFAETHSVFIEKTPEMEDATKERKDEKEEKSPHTPHKEEKEEKKENSLIIAHAREEEGMEWVGEIEAELLKQGQWFETMCMNRRLQPKELATYIMDFCNWLRETQSARESISLARRHFINQLPHIIKKYQTNGTTNSTNATTCRKDQRQSRAQDYAAAIASLAAEESRAH